MLVCIDQRNGSGCGSKNPDEAVNCHNCGQPLRFALQFHNSGTKIDNRYSITQLLGYGAFGAVYEAEDIQGTWGQVALKETFDPTHIQSFQEEFSTLQHLNHPHLPRYYAAFQAHGVGYLVMELIPGQSLRDIQKKQPGPLAERQVLGYAFQLCDVLDYLHNQQPSIIHRDIKPDNIRLTPEGLLKLVDFGLLKLGGGMTQSMRRGLTRAYAPIEQYPHYPGQTDARTDLYSLGATLYHLLTGKVPIPAPDRLGKSPDPLLPPIQHNPNLTPHISEVIMGAMIVPQAGRYLNIAQFGQALRGNQVQLPLIQPLPSQHEPTVRLDEENSTSDKLAVGISTTTKSKNQAKYWLPIAIGIVALLCVIFVVGSGTGYYLTYQSSENGILPTEIAQIVNEPTESPDNPSATLTPIPTETNTPYPTETPLPPTPQNRLPLLHRLGRGSVEALSVSPQENLFAALFTTGIALYDAESYKEVRFIKPDIEDVWQSDLAFSPDGSMIAAGSVSGQVGLWQVADGTLLKRWVAYTDTVKGMAFSPDGSILATSSGSWHLGDIHLWQMPDGKLLKTLKGHEQGVNSLAFSPDGALLASGGGDNMVMLWQVETGNLFKKMKGHAQSVYQVAFSPDGKTLASGGYDKTVFMWQVADGTLLDTTLGHSSADTLAFSPNGVFLVLGDESSVDMCQLSNKACTSLWNKSYLYAKNLAFLSNNKLIVKSDGLNNVTILELSGETAGKKPITAVVTTTETITTTEVMTATTEVMEPTNETKAANKVFLTTEVTQYDSGRSKISFSPHGTTFATTINNVIQLWSIPEGQLGRSMSLPNDYNINELQFSPDGKILASTSYVDPTNDPYTIHLWQVSDGTLLHHWQAFEKESFGKLLFSPDSSILATDRSQTVKLWNISDGTLRHTFEYDDSIYDMFFLNNETFVIHTSGKEQLLHFLDITNNTLLNNSSPFEGNYVKFSPDKTLFVTTKKDDEKNSDHTINVWNRDGSRRYTVEEKIYRSYNVIFSPDGTMLATINWDIKLWQASSGILLSSIDNNSLYLAYNGGGATFSPDGHLFTIFNAEIIYLWKVVGSKLVEVEQIHQPGGVYGEMTFTPDSSKLVVSGNDHTVWIWDVSSLH